jgi:hypothetical protein
MKLNGEPLECPNVNEPCISSRASSEIKEGAD